MRQTNSLNNNNNSFNSLINNNNKWRQTDRNMRHTNKICNSKYRVYNNNQTIIMIVKAITFNKKYRVFKMRINKKLHINNKELTI